ncbi:MBL fold metallo-hydrolase [Ruegeria sp.]|uniref:MBL fold metallo-hydrolase n=1 Tax=Ruegeria sp. TaxID=1879320 RepID=UPI0023242A7C|nr:MBL fold metallo-hydrolase [Ruegeria sp.]MDA7966633.1 MBL fold metallo-hydrolase [Ruegeria sp.]
MTETSTSTMRILEPAPHILAFYDGRIPKRRLHSEEANWLDDGAYSLGIASYALFDGDEGLVYDTGISVSHGRAIRAALEQRGVTSIRVVLSHHHNDHIAGNEAFADCEIITHRKTADKLKDIAAELASDTPPISPVVLPTTVFDGTKTLRVGSIDIELRPLDIHSFDGLVIYIPESRILLAGDTLEDTVTYVAEPARLDIHLAELERLSQWDIQAILPNHGDPDTIASGGYDTSFIDATQAYVAKLLRCRAEPGLSELTLREFVADQITAGSVIYFEGYEEVHQQNVQAVMSLPGDA